MSEAKHLQVVERMKAREAQRIADAAKRHEEIENAGLGTESAAAFLDNFNRLQSALSADIDSYAAGGIAEPEKAHALAKRVSELEQTVASAAYFLPPYDLRNASLAVTAIKDQLDTATKTQQPRKKFSFTKKPAVGPSNTVQESTVAQTESAGTNTNSNPATATTTATTTGTAPPSGRIISRLRGQVLKLTATDFQESEDVTISDLEDCTIHLQSPLGALFIHGLTRCTLIGAPVAGALHLENLTDCKIYAASRQVRIHSAQNCDFYLKVRSGPIIEFSSGLRFAPLPGAAAEALGYPEAAKYLKLQGLDDSCTQDGDYSNDNSKEWADVQDFGWLRASASPNWKVLPEDQRQPPPLP